MNRQLIRVVNFLLISCLLVASMPAGAFVFAPRGIFIPARFAEQAMSFRPAARATSQMQSSITPGKFRLIAGGIKPRVRSKKKPAPSAVPEGPSLPGPFKRLNRLLDRLDRVWSTTVAAHVLAPLESLPRKSFGEALSEFQRGEGFGMAYRLNRPPSLRQLRRLADFPGEIAVLKLRPTETWLMEFLQRENEQEGVFWGSLGSKISKAEKANLVSLQFHNHPHGKPPQPSFQDLIVAERRAIRQFLITPDALQEFHADELSRLDGSPWPAFQPSDFDLEQELLKMNVDIWAVQKMPEAQRLKVSEGIHRAFHFRTIKIPWAKVTSQVFEPRYGSVAEQLRDSNPRIRMRALELMDESIAFPLRLELDILAYFATEDPENEIRLLCCERLEAHKRHASPRELDFINKALAAAADTARGRETRGFQERGQHREALAAA